MFWTQSNSIDPLGAFMNLAEMSWQQAQAAFAKSDLAIIPTGAVEVYGPHLPLGSDGFVAQHLARRLAERVGAIIAPFVPVSDSRSLLSFPGTLTVNSATFRSYLKDLCASLTRWGIKRILIINGHATSVAIVTDLGLELAVSGIRVAQVDFWRAIAPMAPELLDTGALANRHAGEIGTSVLLAVRPDLVDMSKAARVVPRPTIASNHPEVMLNDVPFSQMTDLGMTGDATTATAEKGKIMIARLLDQLEKFVAEWQVQ
jgi:creatinine amidohydrolase